MTTVTTQVDVKSDLADGTHRPIGCTYLAGENEAYKYTVTIEGAQRKSSYAENEVDYESNIDIENDASSSTEDLAHIRTTSVGSSAASAASSVSKKPVIHVESAPPPVIINRNAMAANRKTMKANAAAWAYTRCSFLFFVGLIITWVCCHLLGLYVESQLTVPTGTKLSQSCLWPRPS